MQWWPVYGGVFFCKVPLPLSPHSFSFKACTGAGLGPWFDLGMVVDWDWLMVGLDRRGIELRRWISMDRLMVDRRGLVDGGFDKGLNWSSDGDFFFQWV